MNYEKLPERNSAVKLHPKNNYINACPLTVLELSQTKSSIAKHFNLLQHPGQTRPTNVTNTLTETMCTHYITSYKCRECDNLIDLRTEDEYCDLYKKNKDCKRNTKHKTKRVRSSQCPKCQATKKSDKTGLQNRGSDSKIPIGKDPAWACN